VRGLLASFSCWYTFLGKHRPSDPGDCPGRYHWYETCLCLSALRLSDIEGLLFSCIMRYAYQKRILDRQSYIAQYIGLALFTAGATNSLGNDDLLAAFAAGTFPPSQCCLSLFIPARRLCDLVGWLFQRTDRRRFVLRYHRVRPQLRVLHLYRSMAPIRSISYI